jgi:hypothetical protein
VEDAPVLRQLLDRRQERDDRRETEQCRDHDEQQDHRGALVLLDEAGADLLCGQTDHPDEYQDQEQIDARVPCDQHPADAREVGGQDEVEQRGGGDPDPQAGVIFENLVHRNQSLTFLVNPAG